MKQILGWFLIISGIVFLGLFVYALAVYCYFPYKTKTWTETQRIILSLECWWGWIPAFALCMTGSWLAIRTEEIEGGNCPQCEQPVAVNDITWWCPKCMIGTRDFSGMTLKEARECTLHRRQMAAAPDTLNEKEKALEAIKAALVGRTIKAVEWTEIGCDGLRLTLDNGELDFGFSGPQDGGAKLNGKEIQFTFYDEHGNNL